MNNSITKPEYRPATLDEINHAVKIYERVEGILNKPCKPFGETTSIDVEISPAFSEEPLIINNLVLFYQSKYFNYFLPLKNKLNTTTIANCKVIRGYKACHDFINKSGFLIYRAYMEPSNNKMCQLYVVYYHPIKVGWLRSKLQFKLNDYNFKKETVYKWFGLEMDYSI